MSEALNWKDIKKALAAWEEPEDYIINVSPCGCTLSARGIWSVCKRCHAKVNGDINFKRAAEYGSYHGIKVAIK